MKNLTDLYEHFKCDERKKLSRIFKAKTDIENSIRSISSAQQEFSSDLIGKYELNFLKNSARLQTLRSQVKQPTVNNQSQSFITQRYKGFNKDKFQNEVLKENTLLLPDYISKPLQTTYIRHGYERKTEQKSPKQKSFIKQIKNEAKIGKARQRCSIMPTEEARKSIDEDSSCSKMSSYDSKEESESDELFVETTTPSSAKRKTVEPDLNAKQHSPNRVNNVTMVIRKSVIKTHVSKLPFTLNEFSDDIDPKEFYKQNYNTFIDFLTQLRSMNGYHARLKLYHWTILNGHTYNSMKFVLKIKNEIHSQVYIPFSFAYFFVNCTKAVKLCYAFTMFSDMLKKSKEIISHASFDYCNQIISYLSNESGSIMSDSQASKKTLPRKSMFSMRKTTIAYEEDFQKEDTNEHREDNKRSNENEDTIEGDDSRKPKPTNAPNIQTLNNFKSNSINSYSESEEESSDSKSNSSLEEEEYSTKNKHELFYSEISHQFQKYKISIINPSVFDGKVNQDLTIEQIYKIFLN